MLLKVAFIVLTIVSMVFGKAESTVRHCARQAGTCILAPQATEGPYYWNTTVRRDIT